MRRLLILVVVGLGSVACAPRGNIPTSDLVPKQLCTLEAAVSPVQGVLRGDLTSKDWPVWVSRPGGRGGGYVRWPWGWSARPGADGVELVNEVGRVVAVAGDDVVLPQVSITEADGTTADPYVAHGSFLGGCYGLP